MAYDKTIESANASYERHQAERAAEADYERGIIPAKLRYDQATGPLRTRRIVALERLKAVRDSVVLPAKDKRNAAADAICVAARVEYRRTTRPAREEHEKTIEAPGRRMTEARAKAIRRIVPSPHLLTGTGNSW